MFLHTLGHNQTGSNGHQVVSVLDPAEAFRVTEFAGLVAHVELQQPVAVALGSWDLARADLACLVIDRDDRLGPGAAGGGADLEQLLQGFVVLAGSRVDFETVELFLALGKYLSCELDQGIKLDLLDLWLDTPIQRNICI